MTFTVGDFVLLSVPKQNREFKLSPPYSGPFEVLRHQTGSNDVQCRNLVTGQIKEFHSTLLKTFTGTAKEALAMVQSESDQFDIVSILAYRGQPETRSTTSYLVLFADGDRKWLPYCSDICLYYTV